MSGIRIPGCIVMRLHDRLRLPARYTHPWLLYASLGVIRIPGCYTHPWPL